MCIVTTPHVRSFSTDDKLKAHICAHSFLQVSSQLSKGLRDDVAHTALYHKRFALEDECLVGSSADSAQADPLTYNKAFTEQLPLLFSTIVHSMCLHA